MATAEKCAFHSADRWLVVDTTYFRNDFTDLITFGPPPLFLSTNIDQALTTGVELTAQWQVFEDTFLAASYTHTDATNRTTNSRLRRRPPNKYSIGLNQFLLKRCANVSLNVNWVDHRDDFDPFTFGTTMLDRYTVANAQFYYDWKPSVRFFGRIDNIFDEKYEEVFAFATPRFSAYAGVTIMLGGQDDGL